MKDSSLTLGYVRAVHKLSERFKTMQMEVQKRAGIAITAVQDLLNAAIAIGNEAAALVEIQEKVEKKEGKKKDAKPVSRVQQ